MGINTLKQLYTDYVGSEPTAIDELPSSGSNRRYFRLSGADSLIGVLGTSQQENKAFIYMARHFASKGLPVPKSLLSAPTRWSHLQNDLGDTLLFNAIEKAV